MRNLRSHWSHREPRLTSKLLLRMMIALIGLCLLAQLTGCVRIQTKYVTVPPVPIPSNLLSDCMPLDIPNTMTWGQSVELNEDLLTVIERCNVDKASIRQIEQSRTQDKS
ncbi:Rz1 lytic protein [Yersinia sp. 2105 StPb PI]|uniref:Rz1-like lysis system protein LysC n=1 Tax=Yersinia sp. 2105 StPb PI TaxID=2507058 RepID=UPI000FFC0B11|nr:Rz1 lytic protein [Yersinia sp. 2105 StPb PI]RXA93806.1 Rz1 lytic protein [Yersinia sp. 2105 StPb PI]